MIVQYYHCDNHYECSKTFDERRKGDIVCLKSTKDRDLTEWSNGVKEADDGSRYVAAHCYFTDYSSTFKKVKLYLKDYPVTEEVDGQLLLPLRGIHE